MIPFSFVHLLTLTGLPEHTPLCLLCGVPENLFAVPAVGVQRSRTGTGPNGCRRSTGTAETNGHEGRK